MKHTNDMAHASSIYGWPEHKPVDVSPDMALILSTIEQSLKGRFINKIEMKLTGIKSKLASKWLTVQTFNVTVLS